MSVKKVLSSILKYGLPLAISVGLCYYLFTSSNMKWSDIVEGLRSYNMWWIYLAMFISIFSHIFRAMRWRIQLREIDVNVPLSSLVNSIFGTYAINLVFPRLGEVWRCGYIARRSDKPFAKVFGSMVADRLADTATVLILLILAFVLAFGAIKQYLVHVNAYDSLVGILSSPWLWIGFAVFVGLIVWLFAGKSKNKLVIKIRETVKGLWDGFAAIGHMKGKWKWLGLTVAIWGCYFTQLYVAFFATSFVTDSGDTFNFACPSGVVAAFVVFVCSSIAMGVPANGGIGPWQWAVILAMGIYGMHEGTGVFANIVLGTQTLLLIALGIYTAIAITFEKKLVPPSGDQTLNSDNKIE
ncbi:MAG: flippase-like domain-containing protein [Muribaculaceae bacterium]|nr:flippase-like domain-containing protein [Muribaculaceae bacterium]